MFWPPSARCILLAFMLVLVLPVSSLAQEANFAGEPLRWAADAEGGAPYIFKDPANPQRDIGFEVDLAQALARELQRPIQFRQYDYKSLIQGLERGDFDFAMNGLEITADRLKLVRFSRPYYAFRLLFTIRQDETRFQSLQECKAVGGVIGTLEDTAASRYLQERGLEYKIYDGQVEPYQDLDQERIDGVLFDLPIAQYYARKSLVNPRPAALRSAGNIRGRGYYAIAIKKDNEALARQLDAALARLIVKGQLRQILEKWHIWDETQEEFIRELLVGPRLAGLGGAGPQCGLLPTLAALAADRTALGPAGVFSEDDAIAGAAQARPGFFLLLLGGAVETIRLTIASFALAVMLGLPVALLRLYGPGPLRWLALVYVEFFRGIPVLLLLAFLYFGLPAIAKANGWHDYGITLRLDPFVAAVLGFGLNYGAYEAEIYRAGLGSVPHGQWEAALSLGMSPPLAFRRIILPQALRVMLPPMTNDFVALFKDTSVVSVIAYVELTKQYLILTKSSSEHLATIALATAALYLVMSVPLGLLSRYLEQRWGAQQ